MKIEFLDIFADVEQCVLCPLTLDQAPFSWLCDVIVASVFPLTVLSVDD